MKLYVLISIVCKITDIFKCVRVQVSSLNIISI